MGQQIDARDFHFEGFRLEGARGTLTDPNGQDHPIRPKTFAMLVHLLENPGRLHRREELLEALWPGLVVSDDSLTQCISELRRCFGAFADRIIKTVPRRGYMLIADVEVRSWTGPLPTLAASVEAVRQPREVPPLEDTRCASVLVEIDTSLPGQDGAAALMTTLAVELARYEDLRVRRTPFGGRCDYRVRSSDAGSARILVILEDGRTDAVLWSDRQDRSIPQEDKTPAVLANRLARQVALDSRRKARAKSTDDLTARDLCLMASDHHQRATEADTVRAMDLLQRAVTLDPAYAQAQSWLAYTVQRGLTHDWGPLRGADALTRALEIARHAVALAPYSPLCLSRLAYCMALDGLWGEAVAMTRLALEGPFTGGVNVRVTCSEVLAQAGYAEEAVSIMAATISLDPFCAPTVYSVLGRSLLMAGRPEEALPHLRLCAARLPDYAPCHHSLLMASVETGNLDEALRAWQQIQRLQPGWQPMQRRGPWFFGRPDDEQRMLAAVEAVAPMPTRT